MSYEIQKEAWAGLVKKMEGSQMSECGDFMVFEDNGYSIFFTQVDEFYQQWAKEYGEEASVSFADFLLEKVTKAHNEYEA